MARIVTFCVSAFFCAVGVANVMPYIVTACMCFQLSRRPLALSGLVWVFLLYDGNVHEAGGVLSRFCTGILRTPVVEMAAVPVTEQTAFSHAANKGGVARNCD